MRVIVMTNNGYKLDEIRQILTGFEVLGYRDVVGSDIDVVEDGVTFEENAIKKVQAFPEESQDIILADDSGLEVAALDNQPGIYSARFAGEKATDADNNEKLLGLLQGETHREARFRCVMAIRFPDGRIETCSGQVDGRIVEQLTGDSGFGYDPLFIPVNHSRTFAQFSPEEKNAISHRRRALEKVNHKLMG